MSRASARPATPVADIEPIPTQVGWAIEADHYWFGRRFSTELAGRAGAVELIAHAVGGGAVSAEAVAVLDDIASVTSVADPRIWPLKLGRVAAAYGNGLAAMAALTLAFDSDVLGPWTCRQAAEWLADLSAELGPGVSDPAAIERAMMLRLERGDRLAGLGVPIRGQDERLVALGACMRARGRDQLPTWALLDRVSAILYRERKLRPNIGLGIAAACLDAGFAPAQVGYLAIALTQNVIVANSFEGANQAPEALRALPAGAVVYRGRPPRVSPRAESRPGAATPEARVATVDAFFAARARGELETALALLTDDVTWRVDGSAVVPTVGLSRGRDHVRRWLAAFPDAFVPRELRMEKALADGDDVLCLGSFRHTVVPTGRTFGGDCVLRFSFRGEQICRYHVYEDSWTVARALDPADDVEGEQRLRVNGTVYAFSDRGGRGRFPTVVLVPGPGRAREVFAPAVDALIERGHRVVAIDPPGQGGSAAAPAGWDLAADLRLLLDELSPVGPLALVAEGSAAAAAVERIAAARAGSSTLTLRGDEAPAIRTTAVLAAVGEP